MADGSDDDLIISKIVSTTMVIKDRKPNSTKMTKVQNEQRSHCMCLVKKNMETNVMVTICKRFWY